MSGPEHPWDLSSLKRGMVASVLVVGLGVASLMHEHVAYRLAGDPAASAAEGAGTTTAATRTPLPGMILRLWFFVPHILPAATR